MIGAIVTDIEGTTSAISFVKDVLFPFARKRLPAFVETHAETTEVQHWLSETAKDAGLVSASRNELIEVLITWIDQDRKATPLKALQGMIWKEGYESGAYQAHMYPEVAECLRHWHEQGIRLYVYSSGSVAAQKLFFGYSEAGDLRPLIDGWFDTETGPKREPDSYRKIADSIGLPPNEILFLSDVEAELDAAHEISMQTVLVCRAPLVCPGESNHNCVESFNAISMTNF